MKLKLLETGAGALCLAFTLATAPAQSPDAAVSGFSGVNQKAVPKTRLEDPASPPPPISSAAQGVNKVEGVHAKADGQTVPPPPPPPPPPPTAAGSATNAGSVGSAGTIQAIHGVGGIDTAKMQNLEAALLMKHETGTPAGNGEEHGGNGKAAAAALLAAPLGKAPPKKGPKEDGRAGFQEFEKLQNRGS